MGAQTAHASAFFRFHSPTYVKERKKMAKGWSPRFKKNHSLPHFKLLAAVWGFCIGAEIVPNHPCCCRLLPALCCIHMHPRWKEPKPIFSPSALSRQAGQLLTTHFILLSGWWKFSFSYGVSSSELTLVTCCSGGDSPLVLSFLCPLRATSVMVAASGPHQRAWGGPAGWIS